MLSHVLGHSYCLRNVTFPPNADIDNRIFTEHTNNELTDLQRLFGRSNATIIRELKHRFDGLLIHSIVYYQSYNQEVLQMLIAAMKLDPTGNHQDCLGMTPLHILACSSVHNLKMYRVIVENYPTNLITEDRWGALPLLYAFWGAAPDEIIQFLLDSYKLHYPNHNFNWTMMVETMGQCDTPKENIERLLFVKRYFPEQSIDWGYLLNKFTVRSEIPVRTAAPFEERMQFLFTCGMSLCVEALAIKSWRDHIKNMIHTAVFQWNGDNRRILNEIQAKIVHFEHELSQLKEVTTILELALWQMKIKSDGARTQQQCRMCRITCGADVIIRHVLPFLINIANGSCCYHLLWLST
jgi:hypothetical protein